MVETTATNEQQAPIHDDPEKGDRRQQVQEDNASDDGECFTVYWTQPEGRDPDKPLNWSGRKKWSIIGTLAFLSLLTPLASSMLAPGVPLVLEEFHTTNNQIATFVVSVFVLGFAFGPLVIAPLSELYGRNIIYHVCNVLFTVFTVACALSTNVGMLIAFRFLAGFAGVAVLTCGAGTIVDMMPPEQRGKAMALWSGGPILGPVVGPVCGGFLVEAAGWRWVFWVIAIAAGLSTLVSFFILQETYPQKILERRAAKLRKETGDNRYHSKLSKSGSTRQVVLTAITRPLRMLLFSPLVTVLCTYVAILYGLMYILFTTFTFVFEDIYGFSARSAGLVFIGGGIGNILGQILVGFLSDKVIRARAARGEEARAEDRLNLWITVPTGLALPLGLILYGWTAQFRTHWIVPIIGTGIMGFGMMGLFMSILTYLVDAHQAHAASVTAANAVLRSVLGAVLPLVGLQLYDQLGLGWGNTVLGLILLVLTPLTWILAIFGQRIRSNPKFVKEF